VARHLARRRTHRRRDGETGLPAFVEEVRQRRRPWVASFRPLVTGILRYCGALFAPAETAAAALAITETLRPDVIIVDFSFPTDSGVALQ
jgi:CheY-like chemotaxis protein